MNTAADIERAEIEELYERDFHAWLMRSAALIRQGRFAEIDAESIAEELESMGRSERRELINRLAVLLAHLLKWRYQPHRRGKSWQATIKEQRLRVDDLLADSPGLRHDNEVNLRKAYRYAVLQVLQETPLQEAELPADCPFNLAQVLDTDFLPDESAGKPRD